MDSNNNAGIITITGNATGACVSLFDVGLRLVRFKQHERKTPMLIKVRNHEYIKLDNIAHVYLIDEFENTLAIVLEEPIRRPVPHGITTMDDLEDDEPIEDDVDLDGIPEDPEVDWEVVEVITLTKVDAINFLTRLNSLLEKLATSGRW